ncbi:MAG TPA: hypothetical protein VNJ08_00015 [Bacteriovoracaceae bacterium]|nr:hypothetical protein [Bacteriovoracaceae bacterium]
MKFLFSLLLLFIQFKATASEQELLVSCGKQELAACEKLGAHYISKSDWKNAFMIGEALCGRDMGTGCMFAGTSLLAQGKIAEAQGFLSQGCDKFEPLSCRSLARLMSKAGEKAQANMYFKRACHFGLKDICEDLKNSETWISPSALGLITQMKIDCTDTRSKACLTHLGTINSCVLPLIKLDCQLLAGYLSIYFRAKLIQAEAKAVLTTLYGYQKAMKEKGSYSYDLNVILKGTKPQDRYQYVVGFMKACGKNNTNMRDIYPRAFKHIGPKTTTNILAYFSRGKKDECYDEKAGYEAYAVGSLDPLNLSRLDVWKIDQDQRVEHVLDGLPLP